VHLPGYTHPMPELHDEIRRLAEQIAAGPDDVADLGAVVAVWYSRERLVALGLATVNSMVSNGPEIDENDPRLVAVQERFRDRLRELVRWAREAGRM
jgi:hypothetical protein